MEHEVTLLKRDIPDDTCGRQMKAKLLVQSLVCWFHGFVNVLFKVPVNPNELDEHTHTHCEVISCALGLLSGLAE